MIAATRTESDLRTPPTPDACVKHAGALFPIPHDQATALESVAVLRLARMGLFLSREIHAGRSLEADLQTYADRFPDGLPLDPYTGRPFLWARDVDGYRLEVDTSAVVPALLRDEISQDAPTPPDYALWEHGLLWWWESP